MDILKSDHYGYPKKESWISKNRIMDILNSSLFLEYPKTHLRISLNELI